MYLSYISSHTHHVNKTIHFLPYNHPTVKSFIVELCDELAGAMQRQTEKKMDTFITRPSSSKQVPVNTNSQIDKSDDESDSEATATMNKRQNCSDNASQILGRL